MKRLLSIFLTLITCIIFVGCQNNTTNSIELNYESLSDKEEHLLKLTGNKVLMYELKNIPKDKKYEISIIYEVYEDQKKVTEDIIISMFHDNIDDEHDNENEYSNIGLNFKDDEIMYSLATKNKTYSFGSYNMKENLSGYSESYFTGDIELDINTDIYLYYATNTDYISLNLPLGVPITPDVTNDILKDSKYIILLRLSYKEI